MVFPADGGVDGDRDRPGGRGAASGALHCAARRGLHRGQHAGERGVLGLALGEPDVVLGHGAAVPLPEVRSGPVDQGGGVGELAFEGLLVGLVGDEDRAGEARVSLAAGLQRREQAPAVGQDPVGAAEQVHGVVVLAGEGDAGAVGFQLDGGQECLLGVFFPLGDVVHGHRRGGVPGIALQDVDGQAELGTGRGADYEPC